MKHSWTTYLDLAARLHVFFMLNIYGWGKMLGGQFYRRGHLPEEVALLTLGEAGPFELAWTFMGFSQAYILFIGISQIIGAWLLLWERTKLLGVAILLPILVNIVVFDIIFLDRAGALASASMYTLLLLVVLFCNKERIQRILRVMTERTFARFSSWKDWVVYVVISLILVAGIFGIEQLLVQNLGH